MKKILFRFIGFFLTFVTLILSLISCKNEECGIYDLTLYFDYSNASSALFAKVEVRKVFEDTYTQNKGEYVIAEFEIEEDYYGLYKAGEMVTVAIGFWSVEEKNSLLTLLGEEHLLLYTQALVQPSRFVSGEKRIDLHFKQIGSISNYLLIPIRDGKLALDHLSKLLLESGINIPPPPDFEEFFHDGMNEEELAKAIHRLDSNQGRKWKTSFSGYSSSDKLNIEVYEISPYLDKCEIHIENSSEKKLMLNHSYICYIELNGKWVKISEYKSDSTTIISHLETLSVDIENPKELFKVPSVSNIALVRGDSTAASFKYLMYSAFPRKYKIEYSNCEFDGENEPEKLYVIFEIEK